MPLTPPRPTQHSGMVPGPGGPDPTRLPRPNRVHHPPCAPVSRTHMGPNASRLPAAGPVSTIGPSKRPMLGSGPMGS